MDQLDQLIDQRFEEWQKRLMDTTRKNPLLNWRERKNSILPISPDLENQLGMLLSGKPVVLFSQPEDEGNGWQDDAVALPPRKPGEWVCKELYKKNELLRRLKALFKKCQVDLMEQGLNTLFLAAAFLEWKETPMADQQLSPLILFPVQLERLSDDPYHDFCLRRNGEEDIVVNPALEQKMQSDFKLDISFEGEMDTLEEVTTYLEGLATKVNPRGWLVRKSSTLGRFSFHKMAMVKDLQENKEVFRSHPVLRALCAPPSMKMGTLGEAIDEHQLDKVVDPARTFQILDADSSQQVAIQCVLRGENLVLHGPPGTGKSQTIANMVTELVSRGKSVLFVSEKMAALEVVKGRLAAQKLDRFCLELHSDKVSKKVVVKELFDHLSDDRSYACEPFDLGEYVHLRDELNEYLQAFSEPLGRNGVGFGDLLKRVASPEGLPFDSKTIFWGKNMGYDRQRVDGWKRFFERLVPFWDALLRFGNSPWKRLELSHDGGVPQGVQQQLQEAFEKARQHLLSFQSLAREFSELELRTFELPVVQELLQLALEISRLFPLPRSFLEEWSTLEGLQRKGEEDSDRLERQVRWLETLGLDRHHPVHIPSHLEKKSSLKNHPLRFLLAVEMVRLPELVSLLKSVSEKHAALVEQVGKWDGQFPPGVKSLPRWVDLSLQAQEFLGGFEVLPDSRWLQDPTSKEEARKFFGKVQPLLEERWKLRQGLMKSFRPGFFELPLEDIAHKLKGFLGLFSGGKARIKEQSLSGNLPGNWKELLKNGLRVRQLERDLQGYRMEMAHHFSGCCDVLGVDPAKLARLFERLQQFEAQWQKGFLRGFLAKRASNPGVDGEFSTFCRDMANLWENVQELKAFVESKWLDARVTLGFSSLGPLLRLFREQLGRLQEGVVAFQDKNPASLGEKALSSRDWALLLLDWQGLDELQLRLEKTGEQFIERGMVFDPKSLRGWLALGRKMRDFKLAQTRSTELQVPFPEWCTCLAREGREEKVQAMGTAFDLFRKSWEQFERLLGPGEAFSLGTLLHFFQGGQAWDNFSQWVGFKRLLFHNQDPALESFLWLSMEKAIPFSKLDPILARVYDIHLLQQALAGHPFWNGFSPESQQYKIDKFAQMDRSLVGETRYRVHQLLARELAKINGVELQSDENEVGILRREARKSRKIMPPRELLSRIPNLLKKIKPCLMMSPLTVSQFLVPGKVEPDVVIFDEASQILTEDAIGAICRGKQVVIAGDSQQLPPTMFFMAQMEGNEDEVDYDTVSSADYDSVLDEIQGLSSFRNHSLKWHYRSKSELLITFSNLQFYDGKLVTFPHAQFQTSEHGVFFHHVDDGVYERGGSKKNRGEAQRVVELVEQHFEVTPHKSLGIVTFSLPQAEAIEEELERLWKEHPEIKQKVPPERQRLDGFFVKSLENVQGDERDVMIFSVGYGKDRHGKMTLNFGPLNQKGGERRLNVAITRAREKVLLVSSITSRDFPRELENAGVRALRDYLEYVQSAGKGGEWLPRPGEGVAHEPESPLELDVAQEIQKMGFEVHHQVGCMGYRIDLGVVDPEQPGEYLLGVECDGASYHSSFYARERDRLRQEQLVRQGWRIHRVWSTGWFQNRQKQVRLLQQQLETAKNQPRALGAREVPLPREREVQSLDARDAKGTSGFQAPAVEFDSIDDVPEGVIDDMLRRLQQLQIGFSRDSLVKEVTRRLGWKRTGKRIRARIEWRIKVLGIHCEEH